MLGQSAPTEKPEKEKIGDPQEFLLDTGHFRRIEYPSSDQTAVSGRNILEHYKEIEPDVPEDNRWMLEGLAKYVESPSLVDDFPSEKERNAFQRRDVHDYPEVNHLFESNKLKGNSISNVFGIGEVVESEGWLDSKLVDECERLKRKYKGPGGLPTGYEMMTIEEKIAFTGEIANLAIGLYQAIAERCAPETPK